MLYDYIIVIIIITIYDYYYDYTVLRAYYKRGVGELRKIILFHSHSHDDNSNIQYNTIF